MKEDKNIEKLIRDSLKFEQSPEDFTSKIMQSIEAADQKEEVALSSLMKKHVLQSPSADFTSKVMTQIKGATTIVTNPVIISKKAWAIILAFITALVVYALASSPENKTEPSLFDGFASKLGDLFNQVGGSYSIQLPELFTNPVFAMSLFALSSLILVDYLIKNRRLSTI